LSELIDVLKLQQQPLTVKLYPEIVNMFSKNIFRALPPPSTPPGIEFDPEEDEPLLESAWPHLQVPFLNCIYHMHIQVLSTILLQYVYEFFLKFLECKDFDVANSKSVLDHKFVENVGNFEIFGLYIY
jgi:serine/threonine-protein phosphatase 2A regulatory subunit B'